MEIDKSLLDSLLKQCKSPEEIIGPQGILKQFTKALIERAMEVEMNEHLGYAKHSPSGDNSGNSRNGFSKKKVITDSGTLEITVPRDRSGDFSPQIVEKGQRRFTGFDEKIISMYSLGMSTRDIQDHLKEIYGVDTSPDLISKVTEAVQEDVSAWRNRPLQDVYPIVWFDALWVKVREDNRVINKAVYVALGADREGIKDVLGLWICDSEGATFWMSVISEIQNRGVKDIFIACVDGLKGFPEAIEAVYPHTQVQVCIVHMLRNSFQYVPRKNQKAVTEGLQAIYKAPSESAAREALESFSAKWKTTYPAVVRSWENNWTRLSVMLHFPEALRRLIYTTNAIESLNASFRKVTKNKRVFPNDNSVMKQLYLAAIRRSDKWQGGILGWKDIRNQLKILFAERMEISFTQKK